MWIYRSPIGILKIVRQPDGTFGCAITKQFGRLATRRRQKPTMFFVM